MKVAIRTDFCRNDIDRVYEYASKLAVEDVWAFPEVNGCYNSSGFMELECLKRYKQGFDENNLALRMFTETIDENSILSTEKAKSKAEIICHTIDERFY